MSATNSLKKTVAILAPYPFIPPKNGGQHVTYEFCLALSRRMKTFCVSTKQKGATSDLEVIDILAQSIGKYLNLFLIVQLVRLFRSRKVWLCIVNQPYIAILAYVACKICGVKLIISSHNLEYKRFKHSPRVLVFLLEYLVYRLSDSVFFISKRERNTAIRVFRLNRRKCYCVPIIAKRGNENTRPTEKKNSFSIIFFGNFSYPPNMNALNALLFKICPLLAERLHFTYHVKIFGTGLPEIEEIGRTKNDGIDAVTFLGYVDDLYPHIQSADVMINPVHTGSGSSMKIVDALCAGTTVVSARTGAEGIPTKECGRKLLLVEDKEWDQYVTMILNIWEKKLNLLPTPNSFFDKYSEGKVMDTVNSALSAIRS